MAFGRFQKCVFLMGVMLWTGIYFWAIDIDYIFDILSLLPLVIAVVGTFVSILAMRSSMKDFLSWNCFFIGLYLIVSFLPNLTSEDVIEFVLSLAFLIAGIATCLLGLNLWCGFDFNIVRIRAISATIVISALIVLAFNWHLKTGYLEFFIDNHGIILLLMVGVSIELVATDNSLGYTSLAKKTRHNVKAMEMQMTTMNDAYILRPNIGLIRDLIENKESGSVRMLLLSVDFGERPMVFRKDLESGNTKLEIFAPNHTYINPLKIMTIREIEYFEDHFIVFGDNGSFVKINVLDKVQENMDQALIFGHQIDLDKYMRRMSHRRQIKKNSKDNTKKEKKQPE